MSQTPTDISLEDELKILKSIVDAASKEEMDLSATLNQIVAIIDEFIASDSVFIYLFDSNQDLALMASKTPHDTELSDIKLTTGEGITGWVAQEKTPVVLPKDAYKDTRFKIFDVLPEDNYEAILSVPIIYKGRAIGVVNIQHREPQDYTDRTVNLVESIAKQVGGIIEHSRLYSDLKQRALQFDSLIKVSQSITSESYLDDILNLIVLVTAEMLNSKICSIMILNDAGDELELKATQSLSEEYKKKPSVKVDSSLSGQVIQNKKPLVVGNVCEEGSYSYQDLAKKEGLTSMVSVPMIVKDEAIGIINVYTKDAHDFNDEELNCLQMVANQAAVAVENAKLTNEAAQAKEALEARKLVERAKGILMKMKGLSEAEAHKWIHKKSMDSCTSMKQIAESIILMSTLD